LQKVLLVAVPNKNREDGGKTWQWKVCLSQCCSDNLYQKRASRQQHHSVHIVIVPNSVSEYKCSCLSKTLRVRSVHIQW
jgi:hypothetical protein